MCVLGGRVCQKGVFVSSGKFQTNHYMEQQGKNKQRPRARRPPRGPLSLSTICRACGDCELGNCGQSQPALRKRVSSPFAVSPVLLPFLGMREVAVLPKCRPSQAMVLLGSFCQANPLFFLREKHVFSISPRFLFLFGTRGNSLKFFSSSGLICSLSLGCREVITVVYYLVKDP